MDCVNNPPEITPNGYIFIQSSKGEISLLVHLAEDILWMGFSGSSPIACISESGHMFYVNRQANSHTRFRDFASDTSVKAGKVQRGSGFVGDDDEG